MSASTTANPPTALAPNVNLSPFLHRTQTNMNAPAPKANTAQDGNIAIRQEYDAASQSANIQMLELFIQRHPDHPLAKEARAMVITLGKASD